MGRTRKKGVKNFTNITKQQLTAALREHGTLRGAAKQFRCSIGTIFRLSRKFGLKERERGRSKAIKITKTMLRKLPKDATWKELGAILGCSGSTVRNAFREHGIKKRDLRSPDEVYWCED